MSAANGKAKPAAELIAAVVRADVERVKALLAAGADANAADAHGNTPLHLSARAADQRAQWHIRNALLEAGADPGLRNAAGEPPDRVALKRLKTLQAETPNPRAEDGFYPGELAPLPAKEESPEGSYTARLWFISTAALRAGQAIEQSDPALGLTDRERRNGLHHAAWRGDAEKVRRWLDAGGPIGARDLHGETAALTAARLGRHDILRLLTDAFGGWVHDRDREDRSALHLAVQSGCVESVRVLVQAASRLAEQAGANPGIDDILERLFNGEDEHDYAPLDRLVECAGHWRKRDPKDTDRAVRIARALVSAGADPDEAQNNASAPLVAAARLGHAPLCAVLAGASGKIFRLEFGRDVLRAAIASGAPETVAAVLGVNPALARRVAIRGKQPLDAARERLDALLDAAHQRAAKPQSGWKDMDEAMGRIGDLGRAKSVLSAVEAAAKMNTQPRPGAAAAMEETP